MISKRVHKETYNFNTVSLPSIEKVGNVEKMQEHLDAGLLHASDEIRENHQEKIKVTRYLNDGIANQDFLPQLVEDFLAELKEKVERIIGIGFEHLDRQIDLGSAHRLSYTDESDLGKYYREIGYTIQRNGGVAWKYPTTTIKEDMLKKYLKYYSNDNIDETQKYIQSQSRSPNAILRKQLGLNVLIRPFTNANYKRPELTKDLHLLTTKGSSDLFIEKEGGIVKQLDPKKLDILAESIVKKAKKLGKKTIYIASKNTISKFDKEFVNYLREKLEKSGLEVQDPLFDSFLPTLIDGKYSGEIVVCPPDQAKMLRWYKQVKQDDIPEEVENRKIKDVKVFRIATGSGYGEKFQNDNGMLEETYTLNEKDVKASAERAFKEAEKQGKKLILVTADSRSNVVDRKLKSMVSQFIGRSNFQTKSISDVMKDKLTNPDNDDTVFLTANNVGDYLTDFFPQFFYGKLGKAALGVGYEVAEGFDENGNVVVQQFAPSTGTAPDIDDINQVNPSGMFLGITESIKVDPNAPERIKSTMSEVQKSIFKALEEVSNGNYEGFGKKVLEDAFGNIGGESYRQAA